MIFPPAPRIMAESDLDQVCQVDEDAFSIPWERSWFDSELTTTGAHGLVMEILKECGGLRIGAFSCFRLLMDEMHLMRLAVHPAYRRLGMGISLLEATCEAAQDLGAVRAFLEVRESNANAVALYEKAGFGLIGRRPRYYPETREAALVMSKEFARRHYEHENRYQRLRTDRTSSFSGSMGESGP